jgi:putative ATP-binding cassette transporter
MLLAVTGRGASTKLREAEGAASEMHSRLAAAAVPADSVKKNASSGGDGNMTKADGGALMNVSTDQLIWVYIGIVPIVIIACITFECVHRKWARVDLNEPIPNFNRDSEAGEGMQMRRWLDGYWPLVKQFFFEGNMASTAKFLAIVLLFLSFWALFMDWARNIWQKEFWDAIQEKHSNRFWKAMSLFGLMAIVNVLSSTYQGYAQNILTLSWRATLTRNLQEKWLLERAYYLQHFPQAPGGVCPLDNPDQRIQEDVAGFIDGGIAIFFGAFMCFGRLALFTPILFMLSPNYAFGVFYCPGWLLYVSLLYSGLGSCIAQYAGRWLLPLSFIKEQVEADYRHTAVQVRDNTDSIALYGSEETEHNRLNGRFDRIQRVVWEQMRYNKHLGFFRNFYFLLNDIAPFCILAGNYFRGQISLGQMMQILGALGHVSDSLNAFVQAYSDLAGFRATTERLSGFTKAIEKGAKYVDEATMAKEVSPPGDTAALYAQDICVKLVPKPEENEKDGPLLEDAAVAAADDRILWDKAGLVVQPGERVLLLGPDGSGKSLFLRAVAGCWPATGSVRIGRGDALFIPQRPFVPRGELREALAYPEVASQYTDEEMQDALQAVKLTALYNVSLSEVDNWQKRLSGGELQRLALAHALLRKPGLLVLDETTAAIGEEGTADLYATLGKLLPPSTAVITVDHDSVQTVGSWHNVHYAIDQSTHQWVQERRA